MRWGWRGGWRNICPMPGSTRPLVVVLVLILTLLVLIVHFKPSNHHVTDHVILRESLQPMVANQVQPGTYSRLKVTKVTTPKSSAADKIFATVGGKFRENVANSYPDELGVVLSKQRASLPQIEEAFYRYISKVEYRCQRTIHYAGWDICMDQQYQLEAPCLVYSFGIGFGSQEWLFDDKVATTLNCEVHSFDPSLGMHHTKRYHNSWFHPIALGNRDGQETGPMRRVWEVNTLETVAHNLGHQKTIIDYVKIDIGSSEWRACARMTIDGSLSRVRQVALEIHSRLYGRGERAVPLTRMDYVIMYQCLSAIHDLGFRLFSMRRHRGKFRVKALGGPFRDGCCYKLHYVQTKFNSEKYHRVVNKKTGKRVVKLQFGAGKQ